MSLSFFSISNITFALETIVALICLYAIFAVVDAIRNVFFHPLSRFPGPILRAASAFPGVFSTLMGTENVDIKAIHDQYGHVVRIAPNALSFNTAQAWKDIYGLKKDRTELAKDPSFYMQGPAANILTADQMEHDRIRKHLARSFSDGALIQQEPLLNQYFELLVSKLKQQISGQSKGRVDMMAQYNHVAFDIISDLALGEPFGALESGEYHPWMRNFFEFIKFIGIIRFAASNPLVGLLFRLLQFLKPSITARRRAHLEFLKKKIEDRLNRETDRKDFLYYILQGGDGTEKALSHEEIVGNMRILLTAGSETTATHLSGATWYLLTHPVALHCAQVEVRNAFQDPAAITLRSLNKRDSLPFLNAVIQETFRCYPSIPIRMPRTTGTQGSVIDGHYVPPNTSIGVHQWSTYHSRDNFAAADDFIPERWLPNEVPAACLGDKKDSLQPFSLGPRNCLGKSLAYAEIRSVLTRILWNFDLHLEEESHNWIFQKEYSVWDKPSLWVRLNHRAK